MPVGPYPAAGVDVGGTFTDSVVVDDAGRVRARKVPTTPADQSAGVSHGVEVATGGPPVRLLAHGTTTATNAVLERKIARAALVVTDGFADMLAIARQDRPSLYDLDVVRPAPVIPAERVVTVAERRGADGAVVAELTDAERARVVDAVVALEPEAVAVSLLFAFVDDGHERALATDLRAALDVPVTVASELLPEFREYERTSTCALNAAVAPIMRRYLSRLASALPETRVSVMTSGGGTAALDTAAHAPVHTLLSGPAAGVTAAAAIAAQAGYPDAVAFDMGGTSTDVCLIRDGEPQRHAAGEIGGLPFRTPATAIHTVGAGGGSQAWIDAGGALRVGPESAGAVPGPACYGRGGTQPTVTDAHAVLGHLAVDASFGSGALTLDVEAARKALGNLRAAAATELTEAGTEHDGDAAAGGDARAAAGVVGVVRATMARALRRVSTEQGVDPADLALVAYGGAGPLHACALARELGCPAVLVPAAPGVTSALGLLLAPPRAEHSRTVMATLPATPGEAAATPISRLAAVWAQLADDAAATLARQGATAPHRRWLADVRYAGQSHELRVEVDADADDAAVREALHRAHAHAYGYRVEDVDVEVVTVRGVAEGAPVLDAPPRQWDLGEADADTDRPAPTRIGLADGRAVDATVVHRATLRAGQTVAGPALVRQPDATTLLEPGDHARIDEAGTLVVEIGASR